MKLILSLSLLLTSSLVWSYGTGYSSHPLWTDQHILSGEVTGVTSTGGGPVSYTHLTLPTTPYV